MTSRRAEGAQSKKTRPSGAAVLLLVGVGLVVTACGTNSISTNPVVSDALTQGDPDNETLTSLTSSSSSGGSVIISSSGNIPPVSFQINGVGYNAVTVTVSTQTTLQVVWEPGQQEESITGTNYEPEYSMLGVYITVGGTTQATEMVTNGYAGTAVEASGVIDFSSAIPAGSNGNVNIVVSQPNYDYYCLNFELYCYPVPWMHVLPTHPWNGTLLVQTDSTQALQ